MSQPARMEPPLVADYSPVARVYPFLEYAAFGPALMRARTAHLGRLAAPPARALLLGEGDGRFLRALLRRWPECAVTVVDASPAMLAAARRRAPAGSHIDAIKADIRAWAAAGDSPPASYDLVATHFLFDCLPDSHHPALVAAIERCLSPGGLWLYSDFAAPGAAPTRAGRHARDLAQRALYGTLGRLTWHPNRAFTPPHALAAAHGLARLAHTRHARGLVESLVLGKRAP